MHMDMFEPILSPSSSSPSSSPALSPPSSPLSSQPSHSHNVYHFFDFVIPLPKIEMAIYTDSDESDDEESVIVTEKQLNSRKQLQYASKECCVMIERLDEEFIKKARFGLVNWELFFATGEVSEPLNDEIDLDMLPNDPEFIPKSDNSDASSSDDVESKASSQFTAEDVSEHSDWSEEHVKVKRKKGGKVFLNREKVTLTSRGRVRSAPLVRKAPAAKKLKIAVHSCSKCSFKTSDKKTLKLHSSSHGANAPRIPCDLCGRTLYSYIDMEIHKFNDHEGYKSVPRSYRFYCRPCKQTFHCEPDYSFHLNNHMSVNGSKYQCLSCKNFSTNTLTAFQKHTMESHKFYLCYFCDRSFVKLDQVEKHCLQLHSHFTTTFKCDLCDFSSYEFGLYVEHRDSEHGLIWIHEYLAGYEMCKFCQEDEGNSSRLGGFRINDIHAYLEHMASEHLQYEAFSCNLCPFK